MQKIDPAIFKSLRCYVNVIIIVLIGISFSVYAYRKDIGSRFERMMATFSQESASFFLVLEDEFVLHSQQIESLRSFYRASQDVREDEFGEYVRPLMVWHPDVLVFLWLPVTYNASISSKYDFEEGYVVTGSSELRNYNILSQDAARRVFDELMTNKNGILAVNVHEPNTPEGSSFLFICTAFRRGDSQIEGFLGCILDVQKTASIVDGILKLPLTLSVSLEQTTADAVRLENQLPVATKMLDLAGARILAVVRAQPSYRDYFFAWQSKFILVLGLFSTSLLGYLAFNQTRTQFKLERLIRRRTRELLHKNEELESIINVSYHDLKSPLVNISGFSHELKTFSSEIRQTIETSRDLSEFRGKILPILQQIPESVQFIESNVVKMNAVQDGLLQLAILGRIELNIQPVDMNRFITRLMDSFAVSIKQHDAAVLKDELPDCYADEHQLDRIFSNLIDNALKYKAPDRKPKIVISGKQSAREVIYCVEDNGIGMDAAYAKKIFEPFHRLEPQGCISGQGLGLTIVKRLAILHGGDVWVETEAGKGSRFFLSLPKHLPSGHKQNERRH